MLEKNLINIEKYNKDLVNKIKNHSILGNFCFDLAKSGDVVLIYENFPFHSVEAPQQEALQVFDTIADTSRSAIHVMFGLGLGYLFKRLYLSSQGRIIVYEPSFDILKITFENVDFSPELADERVTVVTTDNELEQAIKKYYMFEDPMNICFLDSYKKLFPAKIQQLMDTVVRIRRYIDSDAHTLYNTSVKWLETGFSNFKKMMESEYIDCLKNKFQGTPAVILSAGPSLQKNIEELKPYKDKVIVICVGAALRAVKDKYNIVPDFSVYSDANEPIFNQVKNVEGLNQVNAIIQPVVYKPVFDSNFKRHFIYLAKNSAFGNWLGNLLDLDVEQYENYGTVAINALFSAVNFGCNPIIFMGQDLAYSNDGNAYFDKNIPDLFGDKVNVEVAGWHGDKVQTILQYSNYIKNFEDLLPEFSPEIRIINATEGGAFIKGMEHIPFREAAKTIPDRIVDVEQIIQDSINNYINPFKARKVLIYKSFKTHINAMNKLKVIIRKAQSIADRMEKETDKSTCSKPFVLKLFKELYDMNNKLNLTIQNECPLLINYIQKEGMEFKQKYRRFKQVDDENIEDKKTYIMLYKNIYDALLERIPALQEQLSDIAGVKL
jgi:hypothetical protein